MVPPYVVLFDDQLRDRFLPLVFTKPVAHLRVGILSMQEKWQSVLHCQSGVNTQTYLRSCFPLDLGDENLLINARYFPDPALVSAIKQLQSGEALFHKNTLIARKLSRESILAFREGRVIDPVKQLPFTGECRELRHITDLYRMIGEEISTDFRLVTKGRDSIDLPEWVTNIGEHRIFIEKDAIVKPCTINTEEGPVYIGNSATVMEGCLIRGPFSLGEGAVLKMGAKIYKDTSVGPYCKVGGEVSNSSLQAYSNKGHDGYLGNSVIGEWCNLGADTNNSNLKNNYKKVKLWDYVTGSFVSTNLQFCGLIMGDHSKCGINTMFNTGTVVGVSANVFGGGFPPAFIPSFSWGGSGGLKTYELDQALDTAAVVMKRRNIALSEEMREVLKQIFMQTSGFRSEEKKTTNGINV